MPHLPDHTTHDPELIAAYAAGDAAGPDLAQATELVAECTDCAALHRDLRAIATALPELPAPARPRDFRLTPEQAASLAPSGWRGLLAAFASPRFRLAAPLGTGLAAIGLAGLLLGTPGTVLPAGEGTGASSATGAAAGAAPNVEAAASAAPVELAPAPSGDAVRAHADSASGKAPENLTGLTGPASSSAASTAPVLAFDPGASGDIAGAGLAAPPVPVPTVDDELALRASTSAPSPATDASHEPASAGAEPGASPWLLVSAVLLLAGVALVVLRLAARSTDRA